MTFPDASAVLDSAPPDDFVAGLRCPITRQPLVWGNAAIVKKFGEQVRTGQLVHVDGSRVEAGAEALLQTADGAVLYLVRRGVFCLLENLAVVSSGDRRFEAPVDGTKRSVQAFYDELGWTQGTDGRFEDARRFEDLRPVASDYIAACHRRLQSHFAPEGRFLLDVASGPIQYDAYLDYSRGYDYRVCADISFQALQQARRRLGSRGLYVLADITRLPFGDDMFDGVISLHTVYHVPKDQQASAFCELWRVLKRGRRAAVVYSWGDNAAIMRALMLPGRIYAIAATLPARAIGWFRRRTAVLSRKDARSLETAKPANAVNCGKRTLYSYQGSHAWFRSAPWPFAYEIASWRSLGVAATRLYVHSWLLGQAILRIVFKAESRWHRFFGAHGQYPVIIIDKQA